MNANDNTAILSITEHFTISYIFALYLVILTYNSFQEMYGLKKICCHFLQHYSEQMRASGKDVKIDYENKKQA